MERSALSKKLFPTAKAYLEHIKFMEFSDEAIREAEEDAEDEREAERRRNREENVVYHVHIERRPPPPQGR